MPKLLCCALRCSHSRLFCALRCCLLLLQLCLLLNHLRLSAFSPNLNGLCHFRIFHKSLSAIFHTSLSPFFFINSCAFSHYLSFLITDEASGQYVVNSTVCCSSVSCSLNYYSSILFVLHKCRTFFSVAHFCVVIVVFSARFGAAFCCFNFAFCWTTFVRFLPFFYLVLSLSYFSHFAVSYLSYFFVTFFLFINSCPFSYYLSFLLPDEACGRNVVNSNVCCSLNYYTWILFVLHKCRNFFSVAHFCAAIVVFSARFGAASCCCNFAFCSTTYVRPLSHLSLLAFVTFVFFTLRCHLFFILRCNLFFFINSCAFSYCLSFLFPDETSGRNVVKFTVSCSTAFCSLNI